MSLVSRPLRMTAAELLYYSYDTFREKQMCVEYDNLKGWHLRIANRWCNREINFRSWRGDNSSGYFVTKGWRVSMGFFFFYFILSEIQTYVDVNMKGPCYSESEAVEWFQLTWVSSLSEKNYVYEFWNAGFLSFRISPFHDCLLFRTNIT